MISELPRSVFEEWTSDRKGYEQAISELVKKLELADLCGLAFIKSPYKDAFLECGAAGQVGIDALISKLGREAATSAVKTLLAKGLLREATAGSYALSVIGARIYDHIQSTVRGSKG